MLAFSGHADAQEAIPVRIGVITSGGQSEVPYAIKEFGLDKKYGFAMEQVDLSAPGQQWIMFRSDSIDVAPGSFVDLMRQRKAGVKIKAFHGFQTYSNRIVAKPDSPIKSFTDLKGRNFGQFGTTVLDWLIVRAAGLKAYNIDLEKDTTLVNGAPPLLNQLLNQGQADAILQFSSLTMGPVKKGDQRIVTDVPTLMKEAGFGPGVLYTQWNVGEKWTEAHPGAIDKLDQMIEEAYAKLKSEEKVWAPLAARVGTKDEGGIKDYRDTALQVDDPPYTQDMIAKTQTMVDAIVAIAGEQPLGFSKIDPDAFIFPAKP